MRATIDAGRSQASYKKQNLEHNWIRIRAF